ncbi:MAG: hypothetical protein JNM21_07845 [Taibaiella sp.]|nr:hypothetical protein [Taibaiella sp.]
MKWINFLFILSFITMSVACNKKHTFKSTAMPEELSYLKGKWKVVAFDHDNGWTIDTTTPPMFNRMEFDAKRVSLRFDNDLVHRGKFCFEKEDNDTRYTLRFAGKPSLGYLSHYVDFNNDTLMLDSRIFDGGTNYFLVKE